jgi:minor histocompatibility antigen H13
MVTVAKGLDVPIKLLWPKSLDLSSAQGYAMLGLGDIVVPGTFVALALRYDLYRSGHDASTPYKKPYFTATLISYVIGLLTTMIVMHNFKAAQPALLYLRYVPDVPNIL